MNLPRLYVANKFKRIVNPISVGITLNTVPLSTAVMTLPSGEELPARSYVELFTPYGSAGMFRVRAPHDAYGTETTTAELEHMIAEVGDYLVKEETSEMMEANKAMQRVFKHYGGSKWKLGSVSDLGSGKIALEVNYNRVLDAMLAILEQKPDCMMAFDFTTSPWTVKIVKKGTTVTAEGRMARNITSATISSDDTELCTRVWYQTFNAKKEGTWTHKDADTKSTYGIVEGTVRTSSDMTAEEINATVNAYLNAHKNPRTSVSIQGVELNQITGIELDRMECGKLFRLAMPDYQITVEDHISSVTWDDVYGDPHNMLVNIGSEEDTVPTFLHNLDSKGRGGGGGGQAADQQEAEWMEYYTEFQQGKEEISATATRVNKANEILEQAGMRLNSKGVLIYSSDNKNNVGSLIGVQANRISLVVTGEGKNAKVNAASIVAGVNNQSGSYVKIKADKINLSGYVTASKFSALEGKFEKLLTGNQSVTLLNAGSIKTNTFRLGGSIVTKMSKYIDGVGYINYLGGSW